MLPLTGLQNAQRIKQAQVGGETNGKNKADRRTHSTLLANVLISVQTGINRYSNLGLLAELCALPMG